MSGFRIDVTGVGSAADLHEGAATKLNDLAPGLPTSVDGGEGTPHILHMLGGCGLEVEALSILSSAAAHELNEVIRTTQETDADNNALIGHTPAIPGLGIPGLGTSGVPDVVGSGSGPR